jgi:predicted ATPase/DNA-binding SARP family transcriptional activator
MDLVEVRVLGTVELGSDAGAVAVNATKQRRLLAALAVAAGETRTFDALIDAVWAKPPPSARKLLQLYVSQLRKLLADPVQLVTDRDGYRLELPSDALDARRFEALLVEGRAAFAAGNFTLARSLFDRGLRLWRGSAYGDLAYERFAQPEADRLEALRLVAAEERIEAELALGRHVELLPEITSFATANPLREKAQAQAMLALYRCGRQNDALEFFASTRRSLRDELGLDPGPDLRELQRRILVQDPELAVPSQPRNAAILPVPPTRLLGRDRELKELEELLARANVRLVVLTGAGGSGKTRVAIEVARRVTDAYANGALFVELAPLTDPTMVIPTIARAVGLHRVEADPFDQVVEALRSREMLLVLDNAEHVRQAAAQLVRLLERAPRLNLLVTSRAVLHVSGEHVYPVDPLPPETAVELYVERASALDPLPHDGGRTREIVDLICRRLDRLPLAIELAAAHARTLTSAELLARLEQRLPLLAGGPRDLPARQLTMEATIAWSMGQLGDMEQRDLRSLTVFAGGWTLDAAEAVCSIDLDRTTRLLDHSLLQRTTITAGSRFEMLETVRQYALASNDSGEVSRLRDRHAEHFASVAESAGLYVESNRPARHDLVRREQDNLASALGWTLERGDIALGLRIAAALENHWVMRSPNEGAHWLRQFLSRADDLNRTLYARSVRALGSVTLLTGELEEGRRLYQASLEEYRRLKDDTGIGILEHRLAVEALRAGDPAAAKRLASQSIKRHRSIGFVRGAALGIGISGLIERADGNVDSALELLDESLRLANETGYAWWSSQMLFAAADILYDEGSLQEARARLVESLPLLLQIDDRYGAMKTLALFAKVELADGRSERAGKLWGAVQAEEARAPTGLWETLRMPYHALFDNDADEGFKRGEADGRQLTFAAALAEINDAS